MFFELIEEIMDLIKENVKILYGKIKYVFVILVFIGWIGMLIFLRSISTEAETGQGLKFLGILISDWFNWISLITFVYTAGWAIFQYRKNGRIKRQEKASYIAKEFAQNIVENLSIIIMTIKNSAIYNKYVLKEDILDSLKFFDSNEARILYKNEDIISDYKRILKVESNKIDKIYHLVIYSQNNFVSKDEMKKYLDDIEIGKENWSKIEKEVKSSKFPFHFNTFETTTLNELEYICMDISTKAADSVYIYQSLHQMFLSGIRYLYMKIASSNTNSSDKVYTNVIFVYNEWIKIYKRSLRIEKRNNKKVSILKNPEIKHI